MSRSLRLLDSGRFAARLPKPLPKPSIPKLPDPNEPDVFEEMTLLEHMIELRDRIVKAVIAVIIAFIAGVYFARPMLDLLRREANADAGFDVIAPTDPITIYFKVAIYIAICYGYGLLGERGLKKSRPAPK